MASPLKAGKQTVNLAGKAAPGSRIRRDPPPVARKTVVPDREEYDRRTVAVGILAFTLGILAAIAAISSYNGWSPSEHTVRVKIY